LNNRRILIIALILGLAAVLALNFYLAQVGRAVAEEGPLKEVVVAATDIPANTRITPEMLSVKTMPADLVNAQAVTAAENAAGSIAKADIVKGEQVLAARIVSAETPATLSYKVPDGMRAISIPVSEVSGVAGFVSAGDKVDILVTYADEEINSKTITYTVFQDISVLATGASAAPKEDATPEVVGTVTLAVTPAQAEVLAYATLKGNFHLTLRSPADENKVKLDNYSSYTFDTFRTR